MKYFVAQDTESILDALGTVSISAVPLPLDLCPPRVVPEGAATEPLMVMLLQL